MNKKHLNKQVQTATKWSIIGEIVVKLISPITNMILARLLLPEAFGVVATVTMIVSLADVFSDAGFQKYIVYNQFETEEDENLSICVAFWTNMGMSVFLWGLIFFFRNDLATVVGNPGLGHVIAVGALTIPLTSLASIQTSIYRKKLNFKTISIVRIIVKTIPLLVTVPLTLFGFSYWSIIIGNICGELCNAILLSILSKWKPRFKYSFTKLKEMFNFCGWSLLDAISSWLVANAGIFIIGRFFNDYYLGIYKTSITTISQITSLISGATISVLFSALSNMQNDESEYRKTYCSFLKGIGLIVIPLGVGILLYKDIVREIFLGNQWIDADLTIGCWGLILTESIIFNDMSGTILLSRGKPRLSFIANMAQTIFMIPVFYISANYGFSAMVLASSIIRILLPLMKTHMACKLSSIGLKDILSQTKWYILATTIMAICGLLMRIFIQAIYFQYISIFICVVIYFAVLCMIPTARQELGRYIKKKKG